MDSADYSDEFVTWYIAPSDLECQGDGFNNSLE